MKDLPFVKLHCCYIDISTDLGGDKEGGKGGGGGNEIKSIQTRFFCTKQDRFLIRFCLLLLTVSLRAGEKCSRENKRSLPTPGAVNLALRCSHVLVEAVDVMNVAMFPVPVV